MPWDFLFPKPKFFPGIVLFCLSFSPYKTFAHHRASLVGPGVLLLCWIEGGTGREHQVWEEDALGSRLSSAAIRLSDFKPTAHIDSFVLLGFEPKTLHVPGKHSTH